MKALCVALFAGLIWRAILVLLSMAALAACSTNEHFTDPQHYDKAGTTGDSFKRDYRDCFRYAMSVPHRPVSYTPPSGNVITTRRNIITLEPNPASFIGKPVSGMSRAIENRQIEFDAEARCMRDKGYTVTQ